METTVDQIFPPLTTARLELRLLSVADTDFVFRHFADPQVAQHLLDAPPLTDRTEAEAIIRSYSDPERKDRNRWTIALRPAGPVIGTCGFHRWDKDHHHAEVGYDLDPAYWGQGYMAEALHTALDCGFARMNLHRVDAMVYVENERSVRLLQKLGFQIEGVLRGYFYQAGKYYDHYFLGLLREEWVNLA